MKKTSKLILAVTLFIPSLSYANNNEPHMYMGLLYSYASVDSNIVVDNSNVDFDNSLLGGMVGYQFHKHFALEARGYGSVSDDHIGGYKVKVSNHFNVLAKAILPIDEEYFKVYGMLGYGNTKITLSSQSESDSDIVYGIGFSVSNHNPVSLDIEWLKAFDDEDFSIKNGAASGDMFNVNLVYHFK